MVSWEAKKYNFQLVRASIGMLKLSLQLIQDTLKDKSKPFPDLVKLWKEQRLLIDILDEEYQALEQLKKNIH